MDTKQYAKVGKGKKVHYTEDGENTLCGRTVNTDAEVDVNEVDENQVCSKCQSVLEARERQAEDQKEAEESKRLEEEHIKEYIAGLNETLESDLKQIDDEAEAEAEADAEFDAEHERVTAENNEAIAEILKDQNEAA